MAQSGKEGNDVVYRNEDQNLGNRFPPAEFHRFFYEKFVFHPVVLLPIYVQFILAAKLYSMHVIT